MSLIPHRLLEKKFRIYACLFLFVAAVAALLIPLKLLMQDKKQNTTSSQPSQPQIETIPYKGETSPVQQNPQKTKTPELVKKQNSPENPEKTGSQKTKTPELVKKQNSPANSVKTGSQKTKPPKQNQPANSVKNGSQKTLPAENSIPFGPKLSANGKPALPSSGTRTLQYRIDLAKWKFSQMLKSKESWYLKKEQIEFYQKEHLPMLLGRLSARSQANAPAPRLSAREHKKLQDIIFRNQQYSRGDIQMLLKYPLNTKISDPHGKEYTLLACFCSGKFHNRSFPRISIEIGKLDFTILTLSHGKIDPDSELFTDQIQRYIAENDNFKGGAYSPGLNFCKLVSSTEYKMLMSGRNDIDRFDSKRSMLEFVLKCSAYGPIPTWRFIQTLLKNGCDTNVVFSNGRTLLHHAAREHGHEDIVRYMYFLGFDKWNQKDNSGDTAYRVAVRYANQPVIDFLEKVPGIDKYTGRNEQVQHKLYNAVAQGDVDQIGKCISAGANPSFTYYPNKTLLMIAAEHDQLDSFKCLE